MPKTSTTVFGSTYIVRLSLFPSLVPFLYSVASPPLHFFHPFFLYLCLLLFAHSFTSKFMVSLILLPFLVLFWFLISRSLSSFLLLNLSPSLSLLVRRQYLGQSLQITFDFFLPLLHSSSLSPPRLLHPLSLISLALLYSI